MSQRRCPWRTSNLRQRIRSLANNEPYKKLFKKQINENDLKGVFEANRVEVPESRRPAGHQEPIALDLQIVRKTRLTCFPRRREPPSLNCRQIGALSSKSCHCPLLARRHACGGRLRCGGRGLLPGGNCFELGSPQDFGSAHRNNNLQGLTTAPNCIRIRGSGEMAEWSKAHDWKSCIRKRIEGSNPSLSANTQDRRSPAKSEKPASCKA
jgi:hypothetical protein